MLSLHEYENVEKQERSGWFVDQTSDGSGDQGLGRHDEQDHGSRPLAIERIE